MQERKYKFEYPKEDINTTKVEESASSKGTSSSGSLIKYTLIVTTIFILIVLAFQFFSPNQNDNIRQAIQSIETAINNRDEEKLFNYFEKSLINKINSEQYLIEILDQEGLLEEDIKEDKNTKPILGDISSANKIKFEIIDYHYTQSFRCEVSLRQIYVHSNGEEKTVKRIFIMIREQDGWKLAEENFRNIDSPTS